VLGRLDRPNEGVRPRHHSEAWSATCSGAHFELCASAQGDAVRRDTLRSRVELLNSLNTALREVPVFPGVLTSVSTWALGALPILLNALLSALLR
jgi:hypothetical protein